MTPGEHREAMPDRVRLASELQRRVVGDRRIGGELRREEERVDLKRVWCRPRRHRRVEPPAHVQNLAGGGVPREQAVGRPGAPVATVPVGREVLLVREDRVGSEKVGGSHGCHLEALYGLIMRVPIENGKKLPPASCQLGS